MGILDLTFAYTYKLQERCFFCYVQAVTKKAIQTRFNASRIQIYRNVRPHYTLQEESGVYK